MSEEKKSSGLPFSAPPGYTGSSARPSTKNQAAETNKKNKQMLKKAKRNRRAPVSVRGLITGLIILLGTAVAVTAVISPTLLNKVVTGQIIQNNETCTVTETNSTNFFNTTCGKLQWNPERLPGKPADKLVEGKTYTFDSIGIRIAPAQSFPVVQSYAEAAPKK